MALQDEEHALQTSWSFWYDRKAPKKTDQGTYQSNLHRLGSFETVEEFWRHYVHVKRPSELGRDTNLYLFRNVPECTPMWEAFPNGGNITTRKYVFQIQIILIINRMLDPQSKEKSECIE